MELDTEANSLTIATQVGLQNILLDEEKQSGNGWGFNIYAIREKYPNSPMKVTNIHQVTMSSKLANAEFLFQGEMWGQVRASRQSQHIYKTIHNPVLHVFLFKDTLMIYDILLFL